MLSVPDTGVIGDISRNAICKYNQCDYLRKVCYVSYSQQLVAMSA